LLLSFIVGPIILRALKRQDLHQVVREGTPDSHIGKGTTPTMGGLIILNSALISIVLWGRFSLSHPYLYIAMAVTLWMGGIGFLDDYLKLKQKREGKENTGLVERWKLTGQITIGFALGIFLWQFPLNTLPGASTTLPFYKYLLIVPSFGILYVAFVTFVMTGTSNAVNLTDGLDGLAPGLMAIAMATLAIFAYVMGRYDTSQALLVFYLRGAGELTVFCSAVFGACVGFLWYNCFPAQVFMGDTGSLALGGMLGSVAVATKHEIVLAIVGGLFVLEALSVIIQVASFKLTGKRVFRMAPIHHHFEQLGWSEPQVVVRFWIIAVVLALVGLSSLKLR